MNKQFSESMYDAVKLIVPWCNVTKNRDVIIKSITATQASHPGIISTKNNNYHIDKPNADLTNLPTEKSTKRPLWSKRVKSPGIENSIQPQRPKLQKQICHTGEPHGHKFIQKIFQHTVGRLHKHQQIKNGCHTCKVHRQLSEIKKKLITIINFFLFFIIFKKYINDKITNSRHNT